jgi:CubicO group peptidase (beta-lactamase class C family)
MATAPPPAEHPPADHPPANHPDVRSAIDLLEAWIEAQRVARDLPGLSIGIVHGQSLVWSGGFG